MGLVCLCFAAYPGCFVDPHDDMADLLNPGRWFDGAGGGFWGVRDEGGRLCACAAFDLPEPDLAELHRVYVRPDRRRRGLGAWLVGWLEVEAGRAGARRARLWSDTRFADGHRLYLRLGYRATGEHRALGDVSASTEALFEKALDGSSYL